MKRDKLKLKNFNEYSPVHGFSGGFRDVTGRFRCGYDGGCVEGDGFPVVSTEVLAVVTAAISAVTVTDTVLR